MSIPTRMSLAGFIATEPDLHFTEQRKEYCRVGVGVERWRHEANGKRTKLDPTFHDMVAFEATAREIYARFRPGDSFIAAGYVHEYEVERPTGSVVKEEFVARKIGHDAARTSYDVVRPIAAVPPERPAVEAPSDAVGL
jgi:single-stranded DNA-binding protein